jgi:hypothetical protein
VTMIGNKLHLSSGAFLHPSDDYSKMGGSRRSLLASDSLMDS